MTSTAHVVKTADTCCYTAWLCAVVHVIESDCIRLKAGAVLPPSREPFEKIEDSVEQSTL